MNLAVSNHWCFFRLHGKIYLLLLIRADRSYDKSGARKVCTDTTSLWYNTRGHVILTHRIVAVSFRCDVRTISFVRFLIMPGAYVAAPTAGFWMRIAILVFGATHTCWKSKSCHLSLNVDFIGGLHIFSSNIWSTNGAFNKNINAGFYHSLNSALFTCSVTLNFKSSLLAILSSIVREWHQTGRKNNQRKDVLMLIYES